MASDNKVSIEIAANTSGTENIDALGKELQAVGTAGADSAAKIDAAWRTLGVKSFAQTQAEIAKVKAALDTVKASGASPIQIKAATEAAQQKIQELEGSVKAVGTAATGLGSMLSQLGPLMAATFGAQQFLSAITSAESLNQSYAQIFGSAQAARQEMEFVRATSAKLGVDTLDLAKAYQQLSASTRGTTLEGKATRDVFEAVTRAMGVMGKSSDETKNAINAIAQMSSKGSVAMEELRGQLGEALPGALKAAADGAGLTTQQLIDMVSTGNVLASDLLPALTKGLNDLYAKAPPPQTVITEWARFKNTVNDTAIAIGEGGASKGIAQALTGLATAAKYGALGVDILGTAIGEGAAALVTWNGSLTTSQDLGKKYGIAKVDEANATDKATAALTQNTAAAQENFRSQELLAQKTVESTLAVQAKYAELSKGAALYTEQQKATQAAQEQESKVLTTLVNLYGTEAEKRTVAATAAQTQAKAAEALAQAENAQVVIANSYTIKLQERAKAANDTTEATRKQIEAAQNEAKALQTSFEKTNALAQAKRIDAELSKAQEQASKDNSARIGEYAGAVSAARAEVDRLTKAHTEGKATAAQVIEAETKLAAATLLYRDAVKDLADAYKQLGIKTPEELDKVAQANKVAWDKIKTDSRISTEDLKKAFSAYAESAIAASGDIGSEQYNITREVLRTEAAAKGLTIAFDENGKIIVKTQKEAQDELNKTKKAIDSATAALEKQNSELERGIAAQEKANELKDRAAALELKKNNPDPIPSLSWVPNFQSEAEGKVWLENTKARMMQENVSGGAVLGNAGVWIDQTLMAQFNAQMQRVKEKEKVDLINKQMANGTDYATAKNIAENAQATGTTGTLGTSGGSTQNHTYTVNIPNYGSVNVASANDANSLTNIIDQLARAKAAAGG